MSLDQEAKTKLAILVKSIEPIVEKQLEEFSSAEVEYVLSNFREYLKYDLTRDFEKIREKNLKESPFDAIINDNLGI
jgi:CRISPR/Cas system endoribonuclease Cas6 (RAMP superfamily)